MIGNEKPMEWIGSSHKDLMALLCRWRRLGTNMTQPRQCLSFTAFRKKSKRGIATPKEDMDIINARLKIAEAYVKGLRK